MLRERKTRSVNPLPVHALAIDGIFVPVPGWPGACMGWGLPRPEPHLWAFDGGSAFYYCGPLMPGAGLN